MAAEIIALDVSMDYSHLKLVHAQVVALPGLLWALEVGIPVKFTTVQETIPPIRTDFWAILGLMECSGPRLIQALRNGLRNTMAFETQR